MGKDQEAQAILGKLDNDPVIGREVDATSYFELEAMEYQRKGVVSASIFVAHLCGVVQGMHGSVIQFHAVTSTHVTWF